MTEPITQFTGKYFFLSNFYREGDGLTVEHRFQAAKTFNSEERKRILMATTPSQAKYYGRRTTLRLDWEKYKHSIMLQLVSKKFSDTDRNPLLWIQLLGTDDAQLVEGNTWNDTYWGVDIKTGEGSNHLGEILMLVRDNIRREYENNRHVY